MKYFLKTKNGKDIPSFVFILQYTISTLYQNTFKVKTILCILSVYPTKNEIKLK